MAADPSPPPRRAPAPAVVAVVVAHEPGPWFDETLQGLAEQSYPALRVVVVDTGATRVAGRGADRSARRRTIEVDGVVARPRRAPADGWDDGEASDDDWDDDDPDDDWDDGWDDDDLWDDDDPDDEWDDDIDVEPGSHDRAAGDDGDDDDELGAARQVDHDADDDDDVDDDARSGASPVAGHTDDPDSLAAWVHEFLPRAVVLPAPEAAGFAAAANRVLDDDVTPGAYYLICHDDVALAPDAVITLVREAGQSNAGVVGPKIVDWDDPRVLQDVGWGVDKFGVVDPLVEPGELDQEQHDAVRDVFALPASCVLVRADLFRALGGFDEVMTFRGEDVDLCWRAQVAGARVIVAPDAVVRHRHRLAARQGRDDTRVTEARHRLRMVLTNYTWLHRLRVVPQLLALTVVETIVAAATLDPGRARAVWGAWAWNLRRGPQIRRRRRALDEVRRLHDHELRPMQERGSAQINRGFRRLFKVDDDDGLVENTRRAISSGLHDSPVRNAMLAWAAVLAVYLLGSRHLLSGPPEVGEFAPFPEGARDLLREWWSGWRPTGLGDAGATPFGEALLGVASLVSFGATGLLRTVLILAAFPIGLLGTWRMVGPADSRRARVGAMVTYAVVPVPLNAMARASLTGLVAYAAAPWILGNLGRALGAAPWGTSGGRPGPTAVTTWPRIAMGLGGMLALSGAFSPYVVVLAAIAGAGLLVGSVIVGQLGRVHRLVVVIVVGVGLAVLLHLPWILDVTADGGEWAVVGGSGRLGPGDISLTRLFHFDTGPFGGSWLTWGLLAPPAFGLLVARGWRLAWAVRGWTVALAAWGVAWAGQWGSLDVALPVPEATLAMAAAGLALATGMSVAAVESDLRRRSFSWRTVAAAAALAGFVVSAGSAFAASVDGRWKTPRGDFATSFTLFDRDPAEGSFRVVWIGEQDVLPAAGWPLVGDLAFATSDDGAPQISHRWIDESDFGVDTLRGALVTAIDGDTNRLGEALADFGVRYIVLVHRLAPEPFGVIERPVPQEVGDGMSEQLDLQRLNLNAALTVYENASWIPLRASAPRPEGAEADLESDPALTVATLTEAEAGPSWRGVVLGEHDVFVAQNFDDGWRLDVGGESVEVQRVTDSRMAFSIGEGGDGHLRYEASTSSKVARLGQAAAWVLAGLLSIRLRVRRRPR